VSELGHAGCRFCQRLAASEKEPDSRFVTTRLMRVDGKFYYEKLAKQFTL
jgi:hypothetical protein